MAARPAQSYANHTRYLFGWHFFVMPVLSINAIVMLVTAVRAPSLARGWAAVVGVALVLGLFCSRWMSLILQTRLIRLEETLRLERLLPGRRADIARLPVAQLIAIRFASDEEVPGLLDRIGAGELQSRREIKLAVKHWRPDYSRV